MKDINLFLETFDKVQSLNIETGIDKDTILKIVEPGSEITFEGIMDFFKKKKEEISKIEFDKLKEDLKKDLDSLKKEILLLKKYVGKDIKKIVPYDKSDEDWWMDSNDDLHNDIIYKLFDMSSFLENNNNPSGDKLSLIFKVYDIEIYFKSIEKIKVISDILKRNNYNKYLGNEIYMSDDDLKRNNIEDVYMTLYGYTHITNTFIQNNKILTDIEEFNKEGYVYQFAESETPNYEDYNKYRNSLNKNNINSTLNSIIKFVEQTLKDINSFNSIIDGYHKEADNILKDIKEDNYKEVNEKYKYLKGIIETYKDLVSTKVYNSKKMSGGILKYFK